MYALVRIIECKKKKKEEEEEEEKKYNAHYDKTQMQRKTGKLGRGGLKGGHDWLLTI